MRIALLTPLYERDASSKSGIAKHYRYLAEALAKLGHEIDVVFIPEFFVGARPEATGVSPSGVQVHYRPVSRPATLEKLFARRTYVRRLCHTLLSTLRARRELRRLSSPPEIIEATSFGALGLAASYGPLSHRLVTRVSTTAEQLSASFQSFQSRAQALINRLERKAILRSRTLLTHTHQHARNIEPTLGLSPGSFAIVPHGIPDLWSPPTETLPGEFTVLFAGQFTERKGIDVVLSAAPRFLKTTQRARMVIAGGSQDSPLVATTLHELRRAFPERFVVVPDPDDVALRAWIERCDLFTAPSRYESFGLVYLEAMRAGKPVVATRVGGIPEVIADGETGLLVAPGNPAALAEAWLRCAEDPWLCARMGLAGRRRFLDDFSAEIMARRSVELYARVIAAHP